MARYAEIHLDQEKMTDEVVVIFNVKEAKIVSDALEAYAAANKRKKTITRLNDWWYENIPVTFFK